MRHHPLSQQYLAVRDALQVKNIVVTDPAARDLALQPELAAAAAGAGKAVMDRVAPAGAAFTAQLFESQVRESWGLHCALRSLMDQPINQSISRLIPCHTTRTHAQVGPQELVRAAGTRAATIGDQLVQQRANDGSATLLPEERGSTDPGMWRPTPPDFRPGTDMQWGRVTPWVVEDVPRNYRMGPPPALNSQQYTQSYMEVRDVSGCGGWVGGVDGRVQGYGWIDGLRLTNQTTFS